MNINITAKHFQLTDALQETINQKIKNIALAGQLLSVDIVMETNKHNHQINAVLHFVDKGQSQLSSTKNDMYEALDDLVNKISRQLNKHKETK